ncbi:hypothetical protein B0H13DRAFT_2295116 [Mycena leptocephala]|nr:hypothetical protein B0H13DRAFT_2295116 [Mycena leptocephala]
MHRDLDRSRLSELPVSMRRTATTAAEGSLQSLLLVLALSENSAVSSQHKYRLLPAIYPNLDIVGIPRVGDFDVAPVVAVRDLVSKASIALQCLHNIQDISLPLFRNLWPRYWKWSRFFYTFHEHLPWMSAGRLSDVQIARNLLWFINPIRTKFPHETREFFSQELGFRIMVVKAWASVILMSDVSSFDYGKICMCVLGSLDDIWDPSNPRNLEELVEGAGGTIDDLAILFVGHINRILSFSEQVTSEELKYFVHNIFCLVSEMEMMENPADQTGHMILAPLTAALLHRGIIPATTTLLCALCRPTESPPLLTLDRCLLLIGRILSSVEGYRRLPDALQAGLLKCLILVGELDHTTINDTHLMLWWDAILPSSMVYYHVVSKMGPALREIEDMEQTPRFMQSRKVGAWQKFKALAFRRLKVLTLFNAAEYVSYRACDNLQCCQIRERTYFRRCSGCQSAYYCSAACQRYDWYADHHRESCSLNQSLSLSMHSSLSIKERGFLRALLNYDYDGMIKLTTRMQELAFLYEHPNTDFFTLFTYTRGLDVQVHAVDDAEWSQVTGAPRWANDVARMVKSDGRLGLHVAVLSEGDGVQILSVPLRTDLERTIEIHS